VYNARSLPPPAVTLMTQLASFTLLESRAKLEAFFDDA
jgi:hypothetical protein